MCEGAQRMVCRRQPPRGALGQRKLMSKCGSRKMREEKAEVKALCLCLKYVKMLFYMSGGC